MDSDEKEELIQEFLIIMEIGNILKITISDYEERLSNVLKKPSMLDRVSANSIFDVLQSIEGLNSSQYDVSQKILCVLSRLKIEEKQEKQEEQEEQEKQEKQEKQENKKEENNIKNKIENKLISNALDYLENKFSQKEEDNE